MTQLTSPYDLHPHTESPAHTLAVRTSADEWFAFRKRFPIRGAGNVLLGHLFHALMRATDTLPENDPRNYDRAFDCIRRIALLRVAEPGLRNDARGPDKTGDKSPSGSSNQSSGKKGQGGEGVKPGRGSKGQEGAVG